MVSARDCDYYYYLEMFKSLPQYASMQLTLTPNSLWDDKADLKGLWLYKWSPHQLLIDQVTTNLNIVCGLYY